MFPCLCAQGSSIAEYSLVAVKRDTCVLVCLYALRGFTRPSYISGGGGGWWYVPPSFAPSFGNRRGGGVAVTPLRLSHRTPGYGELSIPYVGLLESGRHKLYIEPKEQQTCTSK